MIGLYFPRTIVSRVRGTNATISRCTAKNITTNAIAQKCTTRALS